jgi:acyl-lipid omega-6 desaturase (Delta-12 desaturase)
VSLVSPTIPRSIDAAEQARLRTFQAPQQTRAAWQVVSTFGLFVTLTAAMYASVKFSVLLTLLLAIPYSGLMVRIFIIQHDCGHNSLFAASLHNRILGRACSLVTLTPFAWWRRVHARHHVTYNNLDLRGCPADFYTDCLTLAEYEKLSRIKRRYTGSAIIQPLSICCSRRWSFCSYNAYRSIRQRPVRRSDVVSTR